MAFIAVIFLFIIFWAIYGTWLGGFLANLGPTLVAAGGLTGLEAFFYSYLHIWVLMISILGFLGWVYFGSGNQ